MRIAIQTGVLSTRWRHLPHRLSRLAMGIADVRGASRVTLGQIMEAYTEATRRLLSTCEECGSRAIKSLSLTFYLTKTFLCSIGQAVEDVVQNGDTECLEFVIFPHLARPSDAWLVSFGQRFMSFFHACPVAFRWLTRLSLQNLAFGDSDVPNLLSACDKLQFLHLRCCKVGRESVLKIDAPGSELQTLEFVYFECVRIELACVPKLRQVLCETWSSETTPLCCGFVPQLQEVSLVSAALSRQKPFALSNCLSTTGSLSTLCLDFCCQMIWIQPEVPNVLTPMFSNLRDVYIHNVFVECYLNWTLFILQAAPLLKNFYLSRHSCPPNKSEDIAKKANLLWETPNFKHLNLKLLFMKGFSEEDEVMNYIRLVMERCVALKRIELRDKDPCKECKDINPESLGFPLDESSMLRVKEQLTYGFSSYAEIIIR
ncbi:uncharacterized protein LOC124663692 isoform X2 [Lolium rigidum]|nr:uncharacterized protein LOC124663692 isoform X2 [Lolium rigidum]